MKSDQANPKVTATLRTINNIKSSNAIMPDFLKAVQKYHQQLHALNQTSQASRADLFFGSPFDAEGGAGPF